MAHAPSGQGDNRSGRVGGRGGGGGCGCGGCGGCGDPSRPAPSRPAETRARREKCNVRFRIYGIEQQGRGFLLRSGPSESKLSHQPSPPLPPPASVSFMSPTNAVHWSSVRSADARRACNMRMRAQDEQVPAIGRRRGGGRGTVCVCLWPWGDLTAGISIRANMRFP